MRSPPTKSSFPLGSTGRGPTGRRNRRQGMLRHELSGTVRGGSAWDSTKNEIVRAFIHPNADSHAGIRDPQRSLLAPPESMSMTVLVGSLVVLAVLIWDK